LRAVFFFFLAVTYICSLKKVSSVARSLGLAVVELSQYGAAGCGLLICEALRWFWRLEYNNLCRVGQKDELMYINVYCPWQIETSPAGVGAKNP